MRGSNIVQLIGYVGSHLKVIRTDKIKKVVIRMATHYKYKNAAGEEKESTQWHDVVAWDNQATLAETLFVQGSHILVQGSIVYRTYYDKSGHKRYITEIRADHLQNLDR